MRASSVFRDQAGRLIDLASAMTDETGRLELLRMAWECWRCAEEFDGLTAGLRPEFPDNDP